MYSYMINSIHSFSITYRVTLLSNMYSPHQAIVQVLENYTTLKPSIWILGSPTVLEIYRITLLSNCEVVSLRSP